MSDWFCIHNIGCFDTPLLAVYPARIAQNIRLAIHIIGDVNRLRPHVKTSKMAEVSQLMKSNGIQKFKCATIAEAEMLAGIGAPDVMLAYQPVGPKINRFIALMKAYPQTLFSCLVDNADTAAELAQSAKSNGLTIVVFIDLNIGMNRTGIQPQKAMALAKAILQKDELFLKGLHAYDGHIHDSDVHLRTQKAMAAFKAVRLLQHQLLLVVPHPLVVVAGGTPTFPIHSQHQQAECSPGTFVFSDWGYKHSFPDEPFVYAALLITRVISILDKETICVDVGHKSVAAENPLPRLHFLNAEKAIPISQSEEHLVLKIPGDSNFKIGDVLYGVPVHICPTVALYDKAFVVEENNIINTWLVTARNRSITV